MSPRRRIEPLSQTAIARNRRCTRPKVTAVAATVGVAGVVIAIAIAVGTVQLIAHEGYRRASIEDLAVLSFVRTFMTHYTSPDPFHANDYADRIVADATGDFARQFRTKMNEIVIQVARAEPATGTVLDAGVERWNDDGSAQVIVATKITTTSPGDRTVIDTGNRWVTTAVKEVNGWKISSLLQVI